MRTCVMDIETSDLRADIGGLLVACFGELDSNGKIKDLRTKTIDTIGKGSVAEREKLLVQWTKEQWENADIVIGQNHVGFDRHFIDGVLFRYRMPLLQKRILIDTYQTAKGMFAMSGSMSNMVDIMHLGQKDAPSKDDWRLANHGDKAALARITMRCESDVRMTAGMWDRLKPVYMQRYGR